MGEYLRKNAKKEQQLATTVHERHDEPETPRTGNLKCPKMSDTSTPKKGDTTKRRLMYTSRRTGSL